VAHSLSAKKRIRQSAKRRLRNRDRKKTIKVQIKKLTSLITAKDVAGTEASIREAIKTLDRYAAKGTLHKNTAARRKSSLMKKLNALKASPKA
jgi:small subunit ribosomal protein S20